MQMVYWVFLLAAICSAIVFFTFLLIRELDRTQRRMPSVTPDRFGLPFTEIKIKATKGQLTGWYIPAQKNNAPAIVMLHGWGGNAGDLLPFAQLFYEKGFNVLLPNASGHGDSDMLGRSDMLRFSRDFESSLDWLKMRNEVDMDGVMLMGHSIAGAAALLLGSRRDDLGGIITFGVFSHSRQLLKHWIQHHTQFPFWPFGYLAILFKQFQLGFSYDQIAPENTISTQSAPVLVIHGERDEVVPVKDAYKILDNGGDQITLAVDSSGGHATFLRTSKRLSREMQGFVTHCL